MSADVSLRELLQTCERRAWQASDPKTPLDELADAMALEWAFRVDEARAALARARSSGLPAQFDVVAELVEVRLAVREASPSGLVQAIAHIATLREHAGDDLALRARVLHLAATANLRAGQLDQAELALAEGLAAIEPGPAQIWMMDTLGQLLVAQGAWVEATVVLEELVARRKAAADTIGVAISAGHLARLHLNLGRASDAAAIARDAVAGLVADASAFTRVRLRTLVLDAALDPAGNPDDVAAAERALREALTPIANDPHYLVGFAHVSLSLARAHAGDAAGAAAGRDAAARCSLPAPAMLLLEAQITPDVVGTPAWRARFAEIAARTDYASEPEIRIHLLLASRAEAAGDHEASREALATAGRRAASANHPLWVRWVDEAIAERDPVWAAERFTERFAGRPRHELVRTSREQVTIIFSDLVDFTPRTLALSPHDVMATVRGLFELGVPLLAKYRVMPISYLGDGLLAMTQGEGHAARGLAFARELVARAGRASEIRRALAMRWPLDLRAGVASGDVVLGVLGNMFKSDMAAIGVTTNLAARLQGVARPGEVVCSAETATQAGADLPREQLALKGFDQWAPVEACRIIVYTPSQR